MFSKIPFAQPKYGIQQKFLKSEFLETKNENRLHKSALVLGLHNIQVSGRTTIEKSTTTRGDLDGISIGKNCVIADGAVLRPSDQLANDDRKDQNNAQELKIKFVEMKIGDFVVIGKSSVVRAAKIGNYVYVGDSCIIQQRCMLDSCSMLLPNTILAQGTVVPPFTVYGGVPGRCVGRLPPSFQHEMEEMCREFHQTCSRVDDSGTSGRSGRRERSATSGRGPTRENAGTSRRGPVRDTGGASRRMTTGGQTGSTKPNVPRTLQPGGTRPRVRSPDRKKVYSRGNQRLNPKEVRQPKPRVG